VQPGKGKRAFWEKAPLAVIIDSRKTDFSVRPTRHSPVSKATIVHSPAFLNHVYCEEHPDFKQKFPDRNILCSVTVTDRTPSTHHFQRAKHITVEGRQFIRAAHWNKVQTHQERDRRRSS
jgi:hypothetical protein